MVNFLIKIYKKLFVLNISIISIKSNSYSPTNPVNDVLTSLRNTLLCRNHTKQYNLRRLRYSVCFYFCRCRQTDEQHFDYFLVVVIRPMQRVFIEDPRETRASLMWLSVKANRKQTQNSQSCRAQEKVGLTNWRSCRVQEKVGLTNWRSCWAHSTLKSFYL